MTKAFQEPPSASAEGSLDLREFLQKVTRRKWLILGVVVLVASLAGGYSYSRPKVFLATAEVLAQPTLIHLTDDDPLDNLSMATEAHLVRSTQVAHLARTDMASTEAISDLLKRVSVATPENTQILQISFTDSDGGNARQGAQSFAHAYLQFKFDQANETVRRISTTILTQISETDGNIATIDGQLAEVSPESAEYSSLLSKREGLDQERVALQTQLTDASTLSTDPGHVVQDAAKPSAPISPKHQVDLALGILLGLGLGVALASVREQLQDRIEDSSGFRRSLKAPVLGLIPESPMLRGDLPRLVTIDEPRSPAAEAYRTLRTNLLAACKAAKVRTILVTGSEQGIGRAIVEDHPRHRRAPSRREDDDRREPCRRTRAGGQIGGPDLRGPPVSPGALAPRDRERTRSRSGAPRNPGSQQRGRRYLRTEPAGSAERPGVRGG